MPHLFRVPLPDAFWTPSKKVFNNEKTRKDLGWAGAHNPIFNNEKTRKDTKIFVMVVALMDETA